MTWVKLDDSAVDHPKVSGLSDRAFRWWVRGLSYASRFLTDGFLPSVFVRQVPSKTVEELVTPKLWIPQENGAMQVHDYLHHQTRREDVEYEKARNREKAAVYRAKKRLAVTGNVTGNEGGGTSSPRYQEVPNPEYREQIQIQSSTPLRGVTRPQPLIRKRNLHAAFEHPNFDVPQWWHDEKSKGIGGEPAAAKFYQWLSDRVERTGEITEPRKVWLNERLADWLADTARPKSGIPTSEETRRMLAAMEARAQE